MCNFKRLWMDKRYMPNNSGSKRPRCRLSPKEKDYCACMLKKQLISDPLRIATDLDEERCRYIQDCQWNIYLIASNKCKKKDDIPVKSECTSYLGSDLYCDCAQYVQIKEELSRKTPKTVHSVRYMSRDRTKEIDIKIIHVIVIF